MTTRNSFEVNQSRFYHRPDAPAHIDKGCPHDDPSVTTILQALAKPQLVPWAAGAAARAAIVALQAGEANEESIRQVVMDLAIEDGGVWLSDDEMFDKARRYLQNAPNRIRDTAADMGTLIHACADALAKGEPLPPLPDGVSQAEVEAFVEQFERWKSAYGPRYIDSEVEVHNPIEGYAGRFDGTLEMPDGEILLVDLKTGKGVYETVALQLSAYGHADAWDYYTDQDWHPVMVDGYAVLHLRPDGFRFPRIDVTEADYQAFLAAKRLWHWQQAHKKHEWAEIALPTEVTA